MKFSLGKKKKRPENLYVRLLRELKARWKETPGGILNKLTILVLPRLTGPLEKDRSSRKDLMTGTGLYFLIFLSGAWLLRSGWNDNHFGPFFSGIFALILGLLGIYGTIKIGGTKR